MNAAFGFRPHLSRLALACATCCAGAAPAADYTWTGAAGSSNSFWDLASNWSPALPSGADARLLLGAYDTTLRSGVFDVGSVHGSRQLLVQGGELILNASGSSLGTLHFAGGTIKAPGGLTVRTLRWDAGRFSPDLFADPPSQLVVTGQAVLGPGGDQYLGGNQSSLTLRGRTQWLDGVSQLGTDGTLTIGATGRFEDHADSGDHRLHVGGTWRNDGTYVKTGQATTSFDMPFGGAAFQNHGRFLVNQGRVSINGAPSGSWSNTGTLEVADGAVLDVSVFRYPAIEQSGTVRIRGEASFSVLWSGMHSTGRWHVGPSGALTFINDAIDERSMPVVFDGGSVHNDGRLVFSGGITQLVNGAAIVGHGLVELDGAAVLESQAPLQARELRTGGAHQLDPFFPPSWGGISAPQLRVTTLDWDTATLDVPGQISVTGEARLHGGPQWFNWDGSGPAVPAYRKVVNGTLLLGGRTTWSGETDLVGSGRIRTQAGREFIDETAQELPDDFDTTRPVELGVAVFEHHGTYLKTGAGAVNVTGHFDNRGVVRTQGSGRLIFSGSLDQRGTLDAQGARIDVLGPLAQWSPAERRLGGGRYVMRDQAIGLDLGAPEGIAHNAARIELHGQEARLLNVHGGTDRPALANLALNTGTVRLGGGASLGTDVSLQNRGTLAVGEGSALEVGGDYRQLGTAARTWVDGVLQADLIEFAGGVWSAGADLDLVGSASLLTGEVRLGASRLAVDIASLGLYDTVAIAGSVLLGGTLYADFDDASLAEGLYRVLTAAGGLSGSFSVLTNLDPGLYAVDALYGDHHVDLQVTRLLPSETGAGLGDLPTAPVPEPQTYALMAAGGALLWWRLRRRRDA